jgi:hypothetical protein
MKKYILLLILPLTLAFSACDLGVEGLTEEEVVEGLKEALKVGTDTSTASAHAVDGYFLNPQIKIPFPEDAQIIETTLRNLSFNGLCDGLIQKLNRAAEDAADEAKPIFVSAITTMTIEDAWNILKGQDDAATEYLRGRTYGELKTTFKPDIENSLATVGADVAWTQVTTTYNSIPFVTPANTDLADYTTGKALDGLFTLIKAEELKIRQDPQARVTDILQRVFAEQD